MDRLWAEYPHATLLTSGEDVGLPAGQMGNSEVGHTNIGAGFVVYQWLTRIDLAVADGELAANPALNGAIDPTGPWVVAWYENLGAIGRAGNVVMAGHIDYWNVGPAVFYNLSTLEPGDEVVLSGDDGKTYPFAVEWVRQYDSASMPLEEVAGPTEGQSVTLITCGGAFDYASGLYLQRTVVRANRTGPGQASEV